MTDATVEEFNRQTRSAKFYKWAAVAVFALMVASAWLPAKWSLANLAIPFGLIAIAWFYPLHAKTADLNTGAALTALLVTLLAGSQFTSGMQHRQDISKVQRLVCTGEASRRMETLCGDVMGVLDPEPEYRDPAY